MAHATITETIKTAPDFVQGTDLAAERLGGKVLYATDDFFAEKENLIKPGRGIFMEGKYTDRGKWMDGWESRRKRTPGHDWCVVQLATSSKIRGFDIDTHFFLGNHPPQASMEAAYLPADTRITDWENAPVSWVEVLPKSPLDPGSQNFYTCTSEAVFTHIRLHIYPDGGVARLKVYGEVHKNWSEVAPDALLDLAAAVNGARAIGCNDMFFSDMRNLLLPGRGVNMGDGWETKRNRTPNNRDWVVVRLAHPGHIEKITVDTCHFKGNYPDTCSIEGCLSADDAAALDEQAPWFPILPPQKLSADHEHLFQEEITRHDKVSHVRLNIFPDGGVSRLRVWGTL